MKTLSTRAPVPLGSNLDGLFGDFLVVCSKVVTESPECFILTPAEAREGAHEGASPKDGKLSYWLQPNKYEDAAFRDKWDRIGSGL